MKNFVKVRDDRIKCRGKNCYKSRTEAAKVKEEQELMDIRQELELKIYRCAECGKFHLTRL
jgi:hypothetical protein